jgi:hypothetical protein
MVVQQQVDYDRIESIREKIGSRYDNESGVIMKSCRETGECPLGLDCYPSCAWWKNGECIFPRKNEKRSEWRTEFKRKLTVLGISGTGNKKNRRFMNYIGNSLLTATSCALLWFFSCIWVEGAHYIQEPNTVILAVETLIVVACLGLSIHNITHLIGKESG